MINTILGGVLGGVWNVAKNTGRGIRGGVKETLEDGTERTVSAYGRLGRDIAEKGRTFFSGGKKYNKKGELINGDADFFERAGNVFSAGIGAVSDMTLGTAGVALGWGLKKTAQGIGIGTAALAAPVAKGVGHLTYQGVGLAGDTAINAAGFVMNMSKSPYGRGMLMGGTLLGAAAYGGGKEISGGNMIADTLSVGMGEGGENYIESIAGSVTNTPRRYRKPDNLGADGDLVFALHNLR